MIFGKPLNDGSGINIIADYFDLLSLHDTIHYLIKEGYHGEETLFSFANEIRKAKDNHRDKEFHNDEGDLIIYKKVEMPWPIAIISTNLLREYAGYITTNREVQSNLYRLEYVVEKGLIDYNNKIGNILCKYLFRFPLPLADYLDHMVSYVVFKNSKSGEGERRFSSLVDDMKLLNPLAPMHINFKLILEEEAKKINCSVKSLRIDFEKLGLIW
jgi:hypothetical protein